MKLNVPREPFQYGLQIHDIWCLIALDQVRMPILLQEKLFFSPQGRVLESIWPIYNIFHHSKEKKEKQTTPGPYNISLLRKPSSFLLQSSSHGTRREARSNVLASPLLLPWKTTVSLTEVTRLSSIVRTGTQLKFRELRNCSRSEKTSPSYRTLNNVVSALMKRRRRSSL